MTEKVFTGGCQCGAVRYETRGEPVVVAICHCTICRHSSAAPVMAWAMFQESQVRFTASPATLYRSSAEAQRGFCASCGTQICFRACYIPGLIDLTVGSFDSPDALPPVLHYWTSQQLPWVEFGDGLPRHAEFPPFDD